MSTTDRGVKTTESPVEMNRGEWKAACAAQDAHSQAEQAELADVDRRTLGRWLNGEITPALDSALVAVRNAKTTIDKIWHLREREDQ